MSYYIGVDGGGTKTAYALFDEDKKIVAMVKGPGSNHENMEGSFDEAADIIWDGLKSLTKEAGISIKDVSFTLMGLAGIDHQFQHDEMTKRLLDYGLENFEIYTTVSSLLRRVQQVLLQSVSTAVQVLAVTLSTLTEKCSSLQVFQSIQATLVTVTGSQLRLTKSFMMMYISDSERLL